VNFQGLKKMKVKSPQVACEVEKDRVL